MTSTTSTLSVAGLEQQLAQLERGVDTGWNLTQMYFAFFMQAGFALYEVGYVQSKNTKSILLKNVADCSVGALVLWMIGFGFTQGDGAFIGDHGFVSSKPEHFSDFFKLWVFGSATITIISGAVTERIRLDAYTALMVLYIGFLYPIAAYWVWGNGWLSAQRNLATIDFAGSGVVHLLGGTGALLGAYFVGPRTGRFRSDENGDVSDHRPVGQNVVMTFLGTLILWFGWLGFNSGSSRGLSADQHLVSARAAVNTALGSASGAVGCLFISKVVFGYFSLWNLLGCTLGGLVAVTAGCGTMDPGASIFVGFLASFITLTFDRLVSKARIDDVVSAVPVHFACGVWGMLAAGLFSTQETVDAAYGAGVIRFSVGRQVGVQLLASLAIVALSALPTALLLFVLRRMEHIRVSAEDEAKGLDLVYVEGYAYPELKTKEQAKIERAQWRRLQQKQRLASKSLQSVRAFLSADRSRLPAIDEADEEEEEDGRNSADEDNGRNSPAHPSPGPLEATPEVQEKARKRDVARNFFKRGTSAFNVNAVIVAARERT